MSLGSSLSTFFPEIKYSLYVLNSPTYTDNLKIHSFIPYISHPRYSNVMPNFYFSVIQASLRAQTSFQISST